MLYPIKFHFGKAVSTKNKPVDISTCTQSETEMRLALEAERERIFHVTNALEPILAKLLASKVGSTPIAPA